LPAGLPTILNSDGPCRTGSDSFVKWQVAHCCLNSVAPSVGLGEQHLRAGDPRDQQRAALGLVRE